MGKKVEGAWRLRCHHLVPPTLCRNIVRGVNYHEIRLSIKKGQQQLTAEFLPHINTLILLEPYRGTITETGLPVVY